MNARGWLLLAALTLARPAPGAEPHLLVVTGAGGEPFYTELFRNWAHTLLEVARVHLGFTPQQITYLSGDPASETDPVEQASRTTVLAALAALAGESAAAGESAPPVLIVLLGHGTARDERVLFNLPGPDLSANDLDRALGALGDRPVALVNAASSSGAFLPLVSAPGRVVVTATASGAEHQHAHFGGFFVKAFSADAADRDKDRRISLLEAFLYARQQVARSYEQDERLLAEHAMLDDNGDGVGSGEPSDSADDGRLAARLFPGRDASGAAAGAGAAALALEIEARELVERVARLRRRKQTLHEPDYRDRLEVLLVELALNRRALRAQAIP